MESRGVVPHLRLVGEKKEYEIKFPPEERRLPATAESVSYHPLAVSSSVTIPPSPPPPQLSPALHNITALSGALLTLLSKSSRISFFPPPAVISPHFFLFSSLHLIFLTLYAYSSPPSSSSFFFSLAEFDSQP